MAEDKKSGAEDKKSGVDRRTFLKGAAATAGAAASTLVAAAEGAAEGAKAAEGEKSGDGKKKAKPHPGHIVIERPRSPLLTHLLKTPHLHHISTHPRPP